MCGQWRQRLSAERLIWTQEISSDALWFYSNSQSCPLNRRSIRFHSQGVSYVLSARFSLLEESSVCFSECVCVYLRVWYVYDLAFSQMSDCPSSSLSPHFNYYSL